MDARERKDLGRLLKKALLFSFPLFTVCVFVELELRQVVSYYRLKHENFFRRKSEIELLVLGTSQADYGIDPDSFGRPGFNLAMPSQSLTVDAQLIHRYLQEMPRLKAVILSVDYFSFPHLNAGGLEHWRNHYYIRHFDVSGDGSWWDRFSPRNFSLIALFTPNLAMDFARQGFAVNLAPHQRASGWDEQGEGREVPASETEVRELLRMQHSMMNEAAVEKNRVAISGAIEKLRSSGIHVVLVSLPVPAEFRAQLDPSYVGIMERTIEQLRERHGLSYADYRADPRFLTKDFLDADHLSGQGARKFSRILAEEVWPK